MEITAAQLDAAYKSIIWSADVPHELALGMALTRMPKLRKLKIDQLFVIGRDLTVIDHVQEMGIQVFMDAKSVEIPSKLEGMAQKYLKHKPWMLNCMAHACSSGLYESADRDKLDGLKRFADACQAVGTRPCGVTVLTSKTEKVVEVEYNGRLATDQVLIYFDFLLGAGFKDVVCSPKELAAIRKESRFDEMNCHTPGVRPAGSKQSDQARTDTPELAMDNGADYLVIGRPITEGEPAENLENIAVSIAGRGRI